MQERANLANANELERLVAFHEGLLASRRSCEPSDRSLAADCPSGLIRSLERLELHWSRHASGTTFSAGGLDLELLLKSSHAISDATGAVQRIRPDEGPLRLDRYILKEEIGRGGMGIVYRAHDPLYAHDVALKTLPRGEIHNLSLFKQEFRRLADMHHPNLVTLLALHRADDLWFFTMEYVSGLHLDAYVRGEATVTNELGPLDSLHQVERLESCLQQIGQALDCLHGNGLCHRDVKPANIRVGADGCLKMLDFGLVADFDETFSLCPAGTLAYLAPEVLLGEQTTPESDWYSVGRLTYEILCGQLPPLSRFAEQQTIAEDIISRYRDSEFQDAVGLLAEKCERWLKIDPRFRIAGHVAQQPSSSPTGSPFVGRQDTRKQLIEAYERASAGRSEIIVVSGPSGAGKSRLAHDFLDALTKEESTPLVLKGRCLHREATPFKAYDHIVDQLISFCLGPDQESLRRAIEPHLNSIRPMFPGVARLEDGPPKTPASRRHHVKQQAAAFASFLHEVARDRPLVIFVDDVQWADSDSRALTEAISQSRNSRLLILLNYRGQLESSSDLQLSLFGVESDAHDEVERRFTWISLEPLNVEEATELVTELQRRAGKELPTKRIVREGGGNPFWLERLSAVAAIHGPSNLSLSTLIQQQLADLDDLTSRLITIVSVAGIPLALQDLQQMLDNEDPRAALLSLQNLRLVHCSGKESLIWVEAAHDHICNSIVSHLNRQQLFATHLTLAEYFAARREPPVEFVAASFLRAELPGQALPYVIQAAQRAHQRSAYREAATWYRQAIDIAKQPVYGEIDLEYEAGRCSVEAGLGPEAADLLLAAAERVDVEASLRLRESAGVHLLRTGYIEQGLELLGQILADLGMPLRRTKTGTLLSLIFRSVALQVRGMKYQLRDVEECNSNRLRAIDIGLDLGKVLSHFDNLRAAELSTRVILSALQEGEPKRVGLALVLAGVFLAYRESTRPQGLKAIEESQRLADSFPDPFLNGTSKLGFGLYNWLRSDWEPARSRLNEAAVIYRKECPEKVWDYVFACSKAAYCQFYLGELKNLTERADQLWCDAVERSDIYSQSDTISLFNTAWLVRDEVAVGMAHLDGVMEQLPTGRSDGPEFYAIMARFNALLYQGDRENAYSFIRARKHQIRKSAVWKLDLLRNEAWWMEARSVIGMLSRSPAEPEKRRLLQQLRRLSKRLVASRLPGFQALGSISSAIRTAIMKGGDQGAQAFLSAIEMNLACGQRFHAAGTLAYASDLYPSWDWGPISRSLSWEQAMEAEGVVAAERLLDVYVPQRL